MNIMGAQRNDDHSQIRTGIEPKSMPCDVGIRHDVVKTSSSGSGEEVRILEGDAGCLLVRPDAEEPGHGWT